MRKRLLIWLIDAGFTLLRWVITPIMWILAGTIGAWHHHRSLREG